MHNKIYTLLGILFLSSVLWCGEDNTSKEEKATVQEFIFTLSKDVGWMNTGISMERGNVVTITSEESAIGSPVVDPDDPIPFFGHRGLIGKIGEDGLPFIIGKEYRFLTNTIMEGETLFIGWNDKDFEDMEEGFPESLDVHIKIEPTSAPPLISPIDGIWVDTTTPVFEWEDLDNAVQYVLEISFFPDFRIIEQSVTVASSYVNLAIGVPSPQPGQDQPTVQLSERLHYWRVRAQINVGRALAPILEWTSWSPAYKLGVELGTPPSQPIIISPSEDFTFTEDEQVMFEFKVPPDPSYIFWRWRAVTVQCGETPQIDPEDPNSGNPSPWMIFQQTLQSNDPTEPPYMYGYFTTSPLLRGEWLVRVEVKDMVETSITYTERIFSVGCEETSPEGG